MAADPPKKDDKGEKGAKKKKGDPVDDLSPEDAKLKADLDLLAERALDADAGIQKLALESMINEIRSSTSSMTSVPKPLKFLRPHYGTLTAAFAASTNPANKTLMADVLSVLAMTMGAEGERESLKFKLLGSVDDIGTWGHEYVRNLSGEIAAEYELLTADKSAAVNADAGDAGALADVMRLIGQMVPFFIKHNSEPEAIDLLLEIVAFVDEGNCARICLYLEQVARYVPDPEDKKVLTTAITCLRKAGKVTEAVRFALLLGDSEMVVEIIDSCEDALGVGARG
ncbi:hypothetical protein T492DRAFT_892634 [Pavlovales sp. CCMP2436]|nr:hypothetical protein T492DRAFT_892634 [Pavlovales sp. CCMP2436]